MVLSVSKDKILEILKTIPDPELGISIYDLGLIYDVIINKGNVTIVMTLTSMGCPLFSQIAVPIKEKIGRMRGVTQVVVELTFDPPWNIEKMSAAAKLKLGLELE